MLRTRRRCRASAALLGAALLASCGSGSPSPADSAADSYFPMVPGAQWVYSLGSSLGTLELEVTAVGERPHPGGRGTIFVMDERSRGPSFGFAEVAPVGYLVRDAYVARLSGIGYDSAGALRDLGREDPTWMLPLDPRPGHAWSQQTSMFETPEGGGGQLGWAGLVKPRTVVEVPAGRFEDVVEIETIYNDASEGPAAKVRYRDFYARGVGLVKSVSEDPSGDPTQRIEQVLLRYRFPE